MGSPCKEAQGALAIAIVISVAFSVAAFMKNHAEGLDVTIGLMIAVKKNFRE